MTRSGGLVTERTRMGQTRRMDESVPAQETPNAWSVSPGLVGMAWVLAAGTLAYTVLSSDPPGRIVAALAAIGLLVFALFGTVARPRLAIDADGIVVRRLFGRQHLPWGGVRIRVTSTRRLGRQTSLLELDTGNDDDAGGGLIVLGWLDLGTEPELVAEALRAYWH
jgi:hypothetical protein